jgi:phospholipase C
VLERTGRGGAAHAAGSFLFLCAVAGCGGSGGAASMPATGPTPAATGTRSAPTPTPTPRPTPSPTPVPTPQTILHVVIIEQENRTFDNLFAGYPGANTSLSGKTSNGQTVALTPISLAAPYEILHGDNNFFDAWDQGKMDGFDKEPAVGNPAGYPHPQYGYVPDAEKLPYLAMAQQYVLDDNMFASQLDGSYSAHLYIVAGQAGRAVNYPTGQWGCGPPPGMVPTLTDQRTSGPPVPACFTFTTIADELDRKHVSWHWYGPTPGAPGFEWIGFESAQRVVLGPEWHTNVIGPATRFLSDVAAGQLAGVTWISPTLKYSDHAGSQSTAGPQWVASLVNAVGTSQFWGSTVIFVLWDDWGGWYDHVPPPQLDYDGLGIRVPMLCVSPYAYRGVVSHKLYETSSVLKYIESVWGLSSMAASDARATPAGDGCLNTYGKPRPFQPFATTMRARDFAERPSDRNPPFLAERGD